MNKRILLTIGAILVIASVFIIKYHYFRAKSLSEAEQRALFVKERIQYEYDMVKDPVTGKIPEHIREDELALARTLPVKGISPGFRTTNLNFYVPAGPNNIGGRTRGLAYDKRYNGTSNRVIMAGSVSGGIMRSIDGGFSWARVSPEGDVHSVTCFAQDPRPAFQDTWYAGTGESLGNSAGSGGAFYLGHGILKSTNNGATWSPLQSTRAGSLFAFDNVFDIIHRLAVNPANGDVYVAAQQSIMRSQNGGTSWSRVKGAFGGNTATGNTDVVINSTGSKIYVAFHLKNTTDRGVWQSNSGDTLSYTLLGGNTDDAPAGWKVNNTTSNWGRILIELAPSNQEILYAFYENGKSQASPSFTPEGDLFKLDMTGGANTWTNLSANLPDFPGKNLASSDPLALQGGYNMVLKIKPDNPNIVFVGGTNLYRSNDGFASNANTAWIGGYSTNFTYGAYPNSHADIHNLVFDPSNVNRAICANDGGIQVTNDISAGSVAWANISNYQTLQYYYVAIDPTTGKNDFMGGAQDNGTTFRDSTLVLLSRPTNRPGLNDHEKVSGGDGVSVGISNFHGASQFIYFGSQSGSIIRDDLTNYNTSIAKNIRPAQSLLTSNGSGGFGDFITKFNLSPDNSETLFYVNYNKLFRTNAASTVDSTTWEQLTGVETIVNPANPVGTNISIRSMAFSRGPYLSSHSLYFGTTHVINGQQGKIFRLDNYQSSIPSTIPIEITPSGMTGTVQDIAVNPNDDNEIMAVVSSYNTISIWWTNNAKSATPTWYNAEGNLSLPSIRSCMIVTKKDAFNIPVTEYYVGTSIGLYSALNIGAGAVAGSPLPVVWVREGGNILNYAVTQSLSYRPVDNVLLVGTHGNGMYYTSMGSPNYLPNVITGVFNPVRNDKNFISKTYPTLTSGSVLNYQVGNMFTVKDLQIQVVNIMGQRVYQAVKPYQNGAVNISGLSPGTYILNIISNDRKNQFIQKFVKQ